MAQRYPAAQGGRSGPGELEELPPGGGSSLPDEFREGIEETLGESVGDVRVHDDGAAADASEELEARAFTVGQDIYFGAGMFDPESEEGKRLLAHEVAHTVQQGPVDDAAPQLAPLTVSEPGDPLEAEADRVAEAFARGDLSKASKGQAHQIAREAKPKGPRPPEEQPPGAVIRFKGGRALDQVAVQVFIEPALLPKLSDLWSKLEELRTLSVPLAGQALVSVSDHPEMRMMRSYSSKEGDIVELPASFKKDPPNETVVALIAIHEAIVILEHWITLKETEIDDNQLRLDEVGGMPIQGTREGIERYRQQLIVTKTLQALSGTVGGMIGLAVGQLLSDDAAVVAEAGVLGEAITGAMGGERVFGQGKREPKNEARRPKNGKNGGRRRNRRKNSPEDEPRFGDEATGGTAADLRGNINEAWGLARSLKWSGYQTHHIIPSQLIEHPILVKTGIQLNHPTNGMALPSPKDRPRALSSHSGFHNAYNRAIERKLDELDINLSAAELRVQVTQIQRKAKGLLEQGTPLYGSGKQTRAELQDLWYRQLSK